MAIIKMHPFRKWLIEALGGTVMIPGPVGRVKTLNVNQLNTTQGLLLSDDTETNVALRFRARRNCAEKLADALLERHMIEFEEVVDGYYWNVRARLRVVVEDE